MSKKTGSFIKGAMILAIAGIIAKVLSAFFRIPLVGFIGDEGLGYYQMPYPIYTLMITISYVGLPSAISKITSEKLVHNKYYEAHLVFKYTFILLLFFGAIASSIMILFADGIIDFMGWVPAAKYSLLGLSLAPVFVAIMGAFRGYFQGMQDMVPTAISQLVEQFIRVVIGLGLAILLLDMGKAEAAGGATFGATAGSVAGAVILCFIYNSRKKDLNDNIKKSKPICNKLSFYNVSKKVLFIAIPISIGSAMNSFMNLSDSMLVVRRLMYSGIDDKSASALFGQLGKASTLINVPLSISMALVLSIVPAVSEAVERKNKTELNDKITLSIRLALLLGLPSAIGLFSLSKPIMTLIYRENNLGYSVLSILSIGLISIILAQSLTGILQGMGYFYRPIINLAIGILAKVIINYITVPTDMGVNGAALGSLVGYTIYCLLNYYYVKKYTDFNIDVIHVYIKPIISTIIMGGMTIFSYNKIYEVSNSNDIATLSAVFIAIIVYALSLLLVGALQEEDFEVIPRGKKLVLLLKKYKLLRK